jgi:hypothetical protein
VKRPLSALDHKLSKNMIVLLLLCGNCGNLDIMVGDFGLLAPENFKSYWAFQTFDFEGI